MNQYCPHQSLILHLSDGGAEFAGLDFDEPGF